MSPSSVRLYDLCSGTSKEQRHQDPDMFSQELWPRVSEAGDI